MSISRYVKFLRGTPAAYRNLAEKDNDTLYFIYEEDVESAELYLGSKLIAGGASSNEMPTLQDLRDVLLSESLIDDMVLVYDTDTKSWVNKSLDELVFMGASETSGGVAGFVPAPEVGQLDLFLKSDGTWAALPPSGPITSVDEANFSIEDGKLKLNQLSMDQIEGLITALSKKVDAKEGHYLITQEEKNKLDALVLGDDNKLEISGQVNASNVLELDTWIQENGASNIRDLTDGNLSEDLREKIDYITTVDPNHFSVNQGKLLFTPVNGRLITPSEANALDELMAGDYEPFIKSVDTTMFSVVRGKLSMTAIPETLLTPVVGDLKSLMNYTEGTTLVSALNDVYDMLAWHELTE